MFHAALKVTNKINYNFGETDVFSVKKELITSGRSLSLTMTGAFSVDLLASNYPKN
jgi:hypothetical protein